LIYLTENEREQGESSVTDKGGRRISIENKLLRNYFSAIIINISPLVEYIYNLVMSFVQSQGESLSHIHSCIPIHISVCDLDDN